MTVKIQAGGKRVGLPKTLATSLGLPILPPQLVETWVDSLWLEAPLTPAWTTAMRLMAESGKIIIGEVRIFPTEPNRPDAGEWSGCILGDRAQNIPHGGLTTRLVRRVKLGEVSRRIVEILAAVAKKKPQGDPRGINDLLAIVAAKEGRAPKVADGPGLSGADYFAEGGLFHSRGIASPKAKVKAGVRGRRPTEDRVYLDLAVYYAGRIKKGSRKPSADTASHFGFSDARTKAMLREARRRGLLTPAAWGTHSGELTPKAIEHLSNKTTNRRPHQTEKPRPKKVGKA